MKPGNVLLDEEGNAYLSDFGIALDAGVPERTTGTMMRGTPGVPVARADPAEPATPSTDIYALGSSCTRCSPAATRSPNVAQGAARRHLTRPLPSVRDVRPELPPASTT